MDPLLLRHIGQLWKTRSLLVFQHEIEKKRASSCKMRPFGLARDDKTVSIFIDGTPLLVTIEKMFGVTFDKM